MSGARALLLGPKPKVDTEEEQATGTMRERNRLSAELVGQFRDAMTEAVRQTREQVANMPQVPHRKPSGWTIKVNRVDGLIESLTVTPAAD